MQQVEGVDADECDERVAVAGTRPTSSISWGVDADESVAEMIYW